MIFKITQLLLLLIDTFNRIYLYAIDDEDGNTEIYTILLSESG
jgi:hypothetical protein